MKDSSEQDVQLKQMFSRTIIVSSREAEAMDIPEPKWLVDGILSGEGISLWVAKYGTGKSHDLTYIARCLANGFDCFGRKTGEPKNVMYFEVENGVNAILRRLQKMSNETDCGIAILSEPRLDLARSKDQFRLVDYLRGMDAEVLIIDPTMPLIQGNKSEEEIMGEVLSFINREICKRLGIPVILAHHTNRNESYFGSVAWMNYACSAFIKQNAHRTHETYNEEGVITKHYEATMKCLKQREGWVSGAIDNGNSFTFTQAISNTTILCGVSEAKQAEQAKSRTEQVIEWLKENPDHGLSKSKLQLRLAKELKGGERAWHRALTDAEDQGLISCEHGKPVALA